MELIDILHRIRAERIEVIDWNETKIIVPYTETTFSFLSFIIKPHKPKFSVERKEDKIIVKWNRFLNGWW